MRTLIEYRPNFARHVLGKFEAPAHDPVTGFLEEQKIFIWCQHDDCGGTKERDPDWQTTCSSGHVRGYVQRFALQHLHRDPLDPIPGPAPGMPE